MAGNPADEQGNKADSETVPDGIERDRQCPEQQRGQTVYDQQQCPEHSP